MPMWNYKTQKENTGFSDLKDHILKSHSTWDRKIVSINGLAGTTFSVTNKARNIFNWITWIEQDNLAFSFVESNLARKYTKLDPIRKVFLRISSNSFLKWKTLFLRSYQRKLVSFLMAGRNRVFTTYLFSPVRKTRKIKLLCLLCRIYWMKKRLTQKHMFS